MRLLRRNHVDHTYDESSIQVLEGLAGIRQTPGMYIGRTDEHGIMHLINEIISNSIDEFNQNRCTKIFVTVNTKNNCITVEDNGSGIPIGQINNVVTKTHAGGKFHSNAYRFSGGLHGVGLTATNALSSQFDVKVYRDGKMATLSYRHGGKLVSENIIDDDTSHSSGTTIQFIPDPEIFKDCCVNAHELKQYIYNTSSINSGVYIELTIDDSKEIHHYTSGIKGFLDRFIKEKGVKTLIKSPITVQVEDYSSDHNSMTANVALTFSHTTEQEMLKGYINGIETINSASVQLVGARMGFSSAFLRKMNSHQQIPKKLKISTNDIRDIVVGLVLTQHSNPQFDSQTKEKLTSPEMQRFIYNCVASAVTLWCDSHKEEFDKVSKYIIKLAKARAAAKKAQDEVLNKSSSTKNSIFNSVDVKKFTDCVNNRPEENELFITEGRSAGGNAAPVRYKNQAIFRLLGKSANVIKKNKLSDELIMLSDILGCGFGSKKNLKKLRYNKVIILTDADVDGGHIKALLLGFFFRYYHELIERGHVYVAEPPLYRIAIKNKQIYISNVDHYYQVLKDLSLRIFHLVDGEGKILPKELFLWFLNAIENYKTFNENFANQFNIDNSLLEYVIIHFDRILGRDFSILEKLGFKTQIREKTESSLILEFDRGYEHYSLMLNNYFYKDVYIPFYKKLTKIGIAHIHLKVKKTGQLIGRSLYEIASLIDSMLNGNGIEKIRYKGLGEMSPKQLQETTLNEKTRNLVQVTMDDYDKAKHMFDVMLGHNIEEKKKLFSVEE